MMGYYDGGWGGWTAMALMMLLFWGGLVALVVWAIRAPRRSTERRTPQELLAERFARGEISDEEFQRSRDLLTSAGSRS